MTYSRHRVKHSASHVGKLGHGPNGIQQRGVYVSRKQLFRSSPLLQIAVRILIVIKKISGEVHKHHPETVSCFLFHLMKNLLKRRTL